MPEEHPMKSPKKLSLGKVLVIVVIAIIVVAIVANILGISF